MDHAIVSLLSSHDRLTNGDITLCTHIITRWTLRPPGNEAVQSLADSYPSEASPDMSRKPGGCVTSAPNSPSSVPLPVDMGIHHCVEFAYDSNPERNPGRILFCFIEMVSSFENDSLSVRGVLAWSTQERACFNRFWSPCLTSLGLTFMAAFQSFAGHHLLPSHS